MGMPAKAICDTDLVFLTANTPITERTTPVPKLAPAEKHMSFVFWMRRN